MFDSKQSETDSMSGSGLTVSRLLVKDQQQNRDFKKLRFDGSKSTYYEFRRSVKESISGQPEVEYMLSAQYISFSRPVASIQVLQTIAPGAPPLPPLSDDADP
jgi:hypothetical protein